MYNVQHLLTVKFSLWKIFWNLIFCSHLGLWKYFNNKKFPLCSSINGVNGLYSHNVHVPKLTCNTTHTKQWIIYTVLQLNFHGYSHSLLSQSIITWTHVHMNVMYSFSPSQTDQLSTGASYHLDNQPAVSSCLTKPGTEQMLPPTCRYTSIHTNTNHCSV